MPSGGLSMYGGGLQLQQAYPGVKNTGNANVTGYLVAGRGNFPGQGPLRAVIGDTEPNGYVSQVIGDQAAVNWLGPGNNPIYGAVVLGSKAKIDQMNGSIMVGPIAIGGNAQVREPKGIAIGWNAYLAKDVYMNGSGGVVLGADSGVSPYGGYTLGTATIIGQGSNQIHLVNMTAYSRNGTFLGASINENRTAPDPGGVSVGGNIVIAGIGPTNLTNVTDAILIDTNSDIAFAARNYTSADDHSIRIGNTKHTRIVIGGIDFSNGGGAATRAIADANATVTKNDGTIMWSTLTASRTAALPSAATLTPGFTVRLVDFSGAAAAGVTITATPKGADTINGALGAVINTAYGTRSFKTDGVSKWVAMP